MSIDTRDLRVSSTSKRTIKAAPRPIYLHAKPGGARAFAKRILSRLARRAAVHEIAEQLGDYFNASAFPSDDLPLPIYDRFGLQRHKTGAFIYDFSL